MIFTIEANNKKIGFTRIELALKLMQKYQILYNVYNKNYISKGLECIRYNKLKNLWVFIYLDNSDF